MLFNFAAATFWAIVSRTDGRLVGGGGAGLWWSFAGDTRGGFAIGLGLGGGTLGLGLGGGTRAAGALSPPWLNIDDIAATLEERPVGEGVTLAVFFHAGVVLATVPAVLAVDMRGGFGDGVRTSPVGFGATFGFADGAGFAGKDGLVASAGLAARHGLVARDGFGGSPAVRPGSTGAVRFDPGLFSQDCWYSSACWNRL